MRTFNVSAARAEQEGMPVTLSLLMRETKSLARKVIIRRVLVDPGEEWDEGRIVVTVGEGESKGAMVTRSMAKRYGDVGHKAVRCPGQLCGVCGGKGHAADICANAVLGLCVLSSC